MSAVRVSDCPAWAAYVAHKDSQHDEVFAQRFAASVVVPVVVPTGWAGRYMLKNLVFGIAISIMSPEDRAASSLFRDHGLDDSPHVRDVVDAIMPPEHSDRIRGGDTMRLARAAAAWAWSHALVRDTHVEQMARAIAMPRLAMLDDTDGSAEQIAERFDVSLEVAAARVHDLEVRDDDGDGPSAPRMGATEARRGFVALYGGPIDTVEACALEHDRELRAWHAEIAKSYDDRARWEAARRRYDAAVLRARFYPRGWVRVFNAIQRDRRRVERAAEVPESGVRVATTRAAS